MVLPKKAALKGASKRAFPTAPKGSIVSVKNIPHKSVPSLEEVIDKSTSSLLQYRLILSDNSHIIAKKTGDTETILFYQAVPDEGYSLRGFRLLHGDIDEYIYGDVDKIPSREENSVLLNSDMVRKYRPQIKEIQALLAEYEEPLKGFEFKQIRDYE